MTLYLQNQQTSVTWPEPFESTWQLLGGTYAHDLAPKLPHLGMADILFMTTIMSLPRQQRPWGIATWMSDVFALSRPALYELTKRVKQRLVADNRTISVTCSREASLNRNRNADPPGANCPHRQLARENGNSSVATCAKRSI